MCSRTPKKVPQSICSSYTGFAAKSVRIDALGFAAVRKSTHVLETGGERIRNVFEMEGALPERKASAFQVLGQVSLKVCGWPRRALHEEAASSSGRCRVNLKKRPAFGRKCIHRGTRRHEKQHAPSDH